MEVEIIKRRLEGGEEYPEVREIDVGTEENDEEERHD